MSRTNVNVSKMCGHYIMIGTCLLQVGTGVPERNPRHISILKMSNVKDKYGQYEAIP